MRKHEIDLAWFDQTQALVPRCDRLVGEALEELVLGIRGDLPGPAPGSPYDSC